MATQSEIITQVASVSGHGKAVVDEVLKVFGDVVAAELAANNEAPLPGLGKLTPKHRPARTGRNPSTGAAVAVPAKWTVGFKTGKALRDALNEGC